MLELQIHCGRKTILSDSKTKNCCLRLNKIRPPLLGRLHLIIAKSSTLCAILGHFNHHVLLFCSYKTLCKILWKVRHLLQADIHLFMPKLTGIYISDETASCLAVLVRVGYHNYTPQTMCLKQQNFISHNSGSWEFEEQGASIYDFYGEPLFCFAERASLSPAPCHARIQEA